MRGTFKKITLTTIVLLIALGIWFSYSSGYRLSPYDAALAHFDVDKSATKFGDVNFRLSRVYLFSTPNGPRTVIATKEGLLWRAPVAVRFPKSSDQVKTVGWMSYNSQQSHLMVFAVETEDPTVAYIQVGSTTDRIKMEITVKEPVVFSWNKEIDINNLNPVALSKDGKVLYEYRYPKNTTSVSSEDLKWYPVNGPK